MFDHSENDRTDGLGDLSEIVRLVKILDWARETNRDRLAENIEERIHEMPGSITVRDGCTPWQQVVLATEQIDQLEQQAALLTFCRLFYFAD